MEVLVITASIVFGIVCSVLLIQAIELVVSYILHRRFTLGCFPVGKATWREFKFEWVTAKGGSCKSTEIEFDGAYMLLGFFAFTRYFFWYKKKKRQQRRERKRELKKEAKVGRWADLQRAD